MKVHIKALCMSVALSQSIAAYEINTHAFLTQKAYERSVLSPNHPNSILPTLGLDRLPKTGTFDINSGLPVVGGARRYFDDIDTDETYLTAITRPTAAQEETSIGLLYARGFIPGFSSLDEVQGSIPGWLMRGAIREDDNDGAVFLPLTNIPLFWLTGDDRDGDPYGPIVRAVKHFYDPVRNLRYPYRAECEKYTCLPSTAWAMGTVDPLSSGLDTPDPLRRNHSTWVDARNSYFAALTGNIDANGNGQLSTEERLDSAVVRTWRFATMIKSLGHVVHLLQDTAQPQHVRSDAHAPPIAAEDANDEGQADAAIEAFTDYRLLGDYDDATGFVVLGNPIRYMDESLPSEELITPLVVGNYPGAGQTIQFSTPIEFFTTRHIDSDITARRGLADFTNRSFYTSGSLPGSRFCVRTDLRPGEDGCVLTGNPFPLPPNDIAAPGLLGFNIGTGLKVGSRVVAASYLTFKALDNVAPNYVDPTLAPFGGKTPVLLRGAVLNAAYVSGGFGGFGLTIGSAPFHGYTYTNMQYTADVAIPRAIGYSAGMINFFFRGKLEIEPIDQRIFGVINQGEPHTVDADGYPIRTSNNKIFGFEKIRLKVRNLTDPIIESGTNQNVPQVVGAGKLVAVARYHRNACYKPDLSGERQQRFATPPALLIDEPVCASGLPSRTNYQEISVSAPITINSAADLPGGSGGTPPASIEKIFDFSADPIPVNATDLFIQVVYRGQLGEETDGIAVGNIDVQEPTFTAAWNNTDYYYSDLSQAWLVANPMSFPKRGVDQFNVCAGVPSVLVFRYLTSDGTGGLQFFEPPLTPGIVRLAFINAQQRTAISQTAYRVLPQMLPPPSAGVRSYFSKGQQRQASREIYSTANPLPTPRFCQANPPMTGENVWCFDPIQKRRGQPMGDAITPIYYNSQPASTSGTDVDANPAQVAFTGLRPRSGGTVRFDTDAVLTPCPAAATSLEELKRMEQIEAAWEVGIDPKDLGLFCLGKTCNTNL
jgi:hypothetical protein